jgi:uncharacterized protein (DUF2267 family)
MDEPTSAFLEEIRRSHALPAGCDDLDAARAVFYALLRAETEEGCRSLATHFPEELETLWKPALYRCLRETRGEERPDPPATFTEGVRARMPEIGEGEAHAVAEAVLDALVSRMGAPERTSLAHALPEELKDALTEA